MQYPVGPVSAACVEISLFSIGLDGPEAGRRPQPGVGGWLGSVRIINHHNMSNNANVQQAKADAHAAVNKTANKAEQAAKYVRKSAYGH